MKLALFTAASLVGAAVAQNATTGNATSYATGLVAALNANNFTLLAAVLGTQPQLAGVLQQGNYSVFAPTNAALQTFIGNASLASINASVITQILEYHVTTAAVRQAGLSANHTIVPSLLAEPLLGANSTAPLVIYNAAAGPAILEAARDVPIGANLTYQNLLIHAVSSVLTPPLNLTASLAAANLTSLASALTAVSPAVPGALAATPRLTVFAPNNAAFANISSTLATLNATQIQNALLNHVINGTVVYSTNITASTTAVSAAGEPFRFSMSGGQVVVTSGNITSARIVRADIPVTNGVLHIIDAVLANPNHG